MMNARKQQQPMAEPRRLGRRAATLVAVAMGAMLWACAPALKLVSAPVVPAAEGVVSVGTGDNDNTRLSITVEHLALPGKVSSGATTYVVWATPSNEGAQPQNVGALQVSKELTGKLDTVTPYKTFELTVTPEPVAAAPAPTGPVVFTAKVARR